MTAQEMFQEFSSSTRIKADWQAWAYGSVPDKLAELARLGIKTATASALEDYKEGESLPKKGDYSVILDSKDQAVCIIRTLDVAIRPFKDVSAEHAYKEGEGDRSLESWRKVHRQVFQAWLGH